jgi:hypothetical protein
MIVDVSGECRDRLPEELLTRRYQATITQQGAEIQVALRGARFFPTFVGPSDTTVVPGWADQGQLHLELAWPSHCEGSEPDSRGVEMIDDSTYLEISGSGSLGRSGDRVTGTLQGVIAVRPDRHCGSGVSAGLYKGASYRVTLSR